MVTNTFAGWRTASDLVRQSQLGSRHVAESAGPDEVCEAQLTWNIVDVPGADGLGKIFTVWPGVPAGLASAAGAPPPGWLRQDLPSQPRM